MQTDTGFILKQTKGVGLCPYLALHVAHGLVHRVAEVALRGVGRVRGHRGRHRGGRRRRRGRHTPQVEFGGWQNLGK